ncbi:MAG TPA: CsgG/HfaB family protein [Spirochaetota bacterium]|nr:CsgG/HfaB family protein [Spirochaetota bacterium]HNT13121.1 CsgG/HfaB family protein [Spirochaetota bacterium]
MNRTVKTLFILLLLSLPAIAEDRVRLAVLDLSAVNVPEFYAATVRDRIEVSLYKSDKIDLLERNKVQLVLKEHNLMAGACRDESCAIQIGKFLSATHVIVGSVTHLDGYTVTIRVVDVTRGKIVYADSENVSSKEEIAKASVKLSGRILERVEHISLEKVALRKHPIRLSLDGGYALPVGAFDTIVRGGWSVSFMGTVGNVFTDNLFLGIKTGYHRFPGKDDVEYASLLPFMGTIGYTFDLPKSFYISPVLSAGGSWNYMKKDRTSSKGMIEPILNPALIFGYRFTPSFDLHFTADYYSVFEKEGVIQLLSIQLGVLFIF